jgi:hypothetical protein
VILDLIQCEVPQFSSASHDGFSNNSCSLAMFTAIRCASSRVSVFTVRVAELLRRTVP